MNAIQLEKATLSLGGRPVLSGLSLSIAAGEFVGVLGANGAGKTTLMRGLLGLVPLTQGTIRIFGEPATRGNPAIGYLPQTRTAPAALNISGRELLSTALVGNRWGPPVPSSADAREIDRCLEVVGAQEIARRPLARLSGGERQRLMIASALLGQPKLLLLDEPLMSLDPHQQHVVVDLVRDLSRALGLTVLFSAHELSQLLGAIDRVLYLGAGAAAIGTADEVIRPEVLSRLYGAPIEVIRASGHIFVMSGGQAVERDRHDHHGHAH